MIQRFFASLVALSAVVLCQSRTARADAPLATFVYTGIGVISPAGGVPEWQPFLSYSAPTDPPLGLLNNITMTVQDILMGNSYDLTGDFANAESLATSGTAHSAWIGFHVPNGGTGSFSATTEPLLLSGAVGVAPGVGPIDFAGFDLTRVRVMGTSYQGIIPGTFEVTTEFTVYGDRIPEPGSVVLTVAALGAMIVGGRRRRAHALRYGRPSRRG
jgi:hypothetical protein